MLFGMYNKYELALIAFFNAIPVVILLSMGVFTYNKGISEPLLWVGLIGALVAGLIVFGDSFVSFVREVFRDRRVQRARSL